MKIFNTQILFYFIAAAALLCLQLQCALPLEKRRADESIINTSHLDALYAEKVIGGDSVGVVYIYAEYPDYHIVDDADEGIACVDDASRAAIFYFRHYEKTGSPEHLRKGKMLMKFLLAMQAPNGYYYNFIWPDGTIHKDGITTEPVSNFWLWRTFWAFGEALDVLDKNDPLADSIAAQRITLVDAVFKEESFKSSVTDTSMGITFPTWLPKISGTDQAAIALCAFTQMLEQEKDLDAARKSAIIEFMRHYANGIMLLQVNNKGQLEDGAFLSWENLWHAYANIQSYGLLTAGEYLQDSTMIKSALYEVDHFYNAVLDTNGLDHFWLRKDNGNISRYDTEKFPQIAYGKRPMIWGALKAYELTGEHQYLTMAEKFGSWFHGNNPVGINMYDPATGRGFDGITDAQNINKNSGAESTIEALLSLQAIENYSQKEK